MDRKFEEIILNGKKSGKRVEEINKELAEAGATFHLNDKSFGSWTEEEMKEGFIPADEEPSDVVHLHDVMRFKPELAGQTITVSVAEGKYEITFNENGNPVKAIRK